MVDAMGGGNSLGTAQGRIVIDVTAVEQAAQLIKQATTQINASFLSINQSARTAAQGIGQVAAASRQVNQAASRSAASVASSTRSAAQAAKQTSQTVGISVQKMLDDVRRYDAAMTKVERRRGVRSTDQELVRGGAVKIDTSQIEKAEAQVVKSMTNMQNSAEAFGKSLQRLSGIIFPFSVAAGILSVVGIKTSNTIEQMNIRFRALEGSTEAAEARIVGLASEARKFNLPLTEVLAGIARLQPLLKQTGNETNRFVGLVARLAAVNPLQGAEGAALAIGEALSGTGNDFYSLQERFNIPRNLLRQAIAETSNFADALDLVLTRLGITEQVAMEFGQTFQGTFAAARDAVSRMLGEGFTPLLRAITPFIQKIADAATELNKVNSPIPTIIAGILAMTAAAAPLLFAIGKLAELWGKVSSNTRAAAIAQRGVRLAGAGLAAAAGFEIGQRLYGAATGESQQSIGDRLNAFFTQSTALIIASLEGAFSAIGEMLSVRFEQIGIELESFASILREGGARISGAFGTLVKWVGALTGNADLARSGAKAELKSSIDVLIEQAFRSGDLRARQQDVQTRIANVQQTGGVQFDFAARVLELFNRISGNLPETSGTNTSDTSGPRTGNFGFNEDQINAFAKFKQDMANLESDYNDQILRENETYQKRRTDIIFEYNEKVVALQEEETRRRTEAQEDLAREIADVQEESAKEQLKAKRDLESEIAKILRESRIRVLEAAAQLDARAVFEEQRRTKARIGELNTEFDQEQAERKQQADQRIQDLQDEFKREEDKRAQDFQRRMAELDRQKNRELQQLYLQHNDTLREMANQYNRERNARNQAFAQELNDLAAQNGRVLNIHRQGMYQIENELLIWYNRMKQQFSGGTTPIIIAPAPLPGNPAPTPYQTGTSWVPDTSLYKLHEGEGVMTPEVNALARKMLGGNYTQSQLAGLIAGGQQSSSSQSWDFSGMQVIVGDTGGRSDKQIAAMIEDGLYQFFTRASMQRKAMVA